MRVVLAVAIALLSTAALAGPQCTTEPAGKWLPEDAIRQKAAAMGHTIAVFKKTDGKRIEIYFNPVNGDIVRHAARWRRRTRDPWGRAPWLVVSAARRRCSSRSH